MEFQTQTKLFDHLLSKEENRKCVDCKRNLPRWASVGYGSFTCMYCAGAHRKLGTQFTQVESISLDLWKSDKLEMYKYMTNYLINAYWEARMPDGYKRPNENSSSNDLDFFI